MSNLKFKLIDYLNESQLLNFNQDHYYRMHPDRLNIISSNYQGTNTERLNYFDFNLKENYFFWSKRGMIDYLRSTSQITIFNQIRYKVFPTTKGGVIINNQSFYENLCVKSNFFNEFYLTREDLVISLSKSLFNGSLGSSSSQVVHCGLSKDYNPYNRSKLYNPSDIFYVFQHGVFQLNTETGELKFLALFVIDYTTKNIKFIIREEYKQFLKSVTLFKTFSKLIEQLKNCNYILNTSIEFETSKDFSEYIEIKEINISLEINSLKYKEVLNKNKDNLVQSILSESEYAETVRVIDSIGDTAVPNESANVEEQEASLLQ